VKRVAALLLASAGLVRGAVAGPTCGLDGGCGAIDPALVRAAVRGDARDAGRNAERTGGPYVDSLRAGGRKTPLATASPDPSGEWERRLGGPGAREDYNCALSFGAGGTLGGDGFLAARLLGRTLINRK
jgi:hypothetical protein